MTGIQGVRSLFCSGMRKVIFLLALCCSVSFGITLEVCQVHKALSLHGTDVVAEFKGEQIQAGIYPSPVVLFGAMPEALINAVGAPYRFPPSEQFKLPESNLLVLCGITLSAEHEGEEMVAVFDLSKLSIPEEVDLTAYTIMTLSIEALKRTLIDYQDPENDPVKIRIEIRGTSKGTASLKSLSEKFSTKR